MTRSNLAIVIFAVVCGLAVPPFLKHASSPPGYVFAGTILFFATLLTYAYWKGQRILKTVPQPETWSLAQRRLTLNKLESQLKSLRMMRRRPIYVLLFLLLGLTVTGAAASGLPNFPATANETAMLQGWGTLFGIGYAITTILFAKTWLTGGWERYIDSYVMKAETLRAQIHSLPH